jgi:hypothetical protein
MFGKRRRKFMAVSSVPRLHEDEAQFSGGFEDELAVAFGAGGIVEGEELVGDVTTAAGEVGHAVLEGPGRAGGAPGTAGFLEELADGIEDLGSVLGNEADDFAVDVDAVFAEDGFDGEILAGRDADELGDFEIGGAEAVEESDEAVGVAAGDGEVGAAERAPGWGEGPVEFLVANAAEELGVGSGTASAESAKGATLAEEAAEVNGRIDVDLRFVHIDSNSQSETCVSHRERYGSLIIKELSGMKPGKLRQICLTCRSSRVRGPAPLVPWYGTAGRIQGRRQRAVER